MKTNLKAFFFSVVISLGALSSNSQSEICLPDLRITLGSIGPTHLSDSVLPDSVLLEKINVKNRLGAFLGRSPTQAEFETTWKAHKVGVGPNYTRANLAAKTRILRTTFNSETSSQLIRLGIAGNDGLDGVNPFVVLKMNFENGKIPSDEEITRAFRQAVLATHPDRNPGLGDAAFKRVTAAKEALLASPERKSHFAQLFWKLEKKDDSWINVEQIEKGVAKLIAQEKEEEFRLIHETLAAVDYHGSIRTHLKDQPRAKNPLYLSENSEPLPKFSENGMGYSSNLRLLGQIKADIQTLFSYSNVVINYTQKDGTKRSVPLWETSSFQKYILATIEDRKDQIKDGAPSDAINAVIFGFNFEINWRLKDIALKKKEMEKQIIPERFLNWAHIQAAKRSMGHAVDDSPPKECFRDFDVYNSAKTALENKANEFLGLSLQMQDLFYWLESRVDSSALLDAAKHSIQLLGEFASKDLGMSGKMKETYKNQILEIFYILHIRAGISLERLNETGFLKLLEPFYGPGEFLEKGMSSWRLKLVDNLVASINNKKPDLALWRFVGKFKWGAFELPDVVIDALKNNLELLDQNFILEELKKSPKSLKKIESEFF